MIVLPGADPVRAEDFAETLRAAVAGARWPEPLNRSRVTVSIGAALFPRDAGAPGQLISVADQALYRAKHDGRNRVILARPA